MLANPLPGHRCQPLRVERGNWLVGTFGQGRKIIRRACTFQVELQEFCPLAALHECTVLFRESAHGHELENPVKAGEVLLRRCYGIEIFFYLINEANEPCTPLAGPQAMHCVPE